MFLFYLQFLFETELSIRLNSNDLQIERKIGGGSFGTVFLGTYKGNKVAIKQMKQTILGQNNNNKGLEEFEIDFCCLYAIGMKGKEVKAYTNLSRHYKDSSEVRQKLGLVESDTNLSNFLQKLLKNEAE